VKVVGLFKMCLNGTNNSAWMSKHLPDELPVLNGLKHGVAFYRHFFSFSLDVLLGRS
jgi:hypothetical protein